MLKDRLWLDIQHVKPAKHNALVSSSNSLIHFPAPLCMSGRRLINPSRSCEARGIYCPCFPLINIRSCLASRLSRLLSFSCDHSPSSDEGYLSSSSPQLSCDTLLLLNNPSVSPIHFSVSLILIFSFSSNYLFSSYFGFTLPKAARTFL